MKFEIPKINKCCFCIPLRYGLLAWAYFKLVWCIFLSTLVTVRLIKSIRRTSFTIDMSIPLVFITNLVIEIFITIIFVIGAHKKNPKLLRVYYIYALIYLGIILLLGLFLFGFIIISFVSHMTFSSGIHNIYETSIFGTGAILFNFYILSLVRSEILKLENNTQFSFQNVQNGETCTMEHMDV